MAPPQPPQPGSAVTVRYEPPYGSCGGVVTRVVGQGVYVCYDGKAHEYEDALDWSDAAVRRIVTVRRPRPPPPPPAVGEQSAAPAKKTDRRSKAEKVTGWGGPSRRRRVRRPAPEPEATVGPKPATPTGVAPQRRDGTPSRSPVPSVFTSPVVSSGDVPFVRTPSGRLVAGSPESSPETSPEPERRSSRSNTSNRAAAGAGAGAGAVPQSRAPRRTVSRLQELASKEQELEAVAARIEQELNESLADLSLAEPVESSLRLQSEKKERATPVRFTK